MEILLTILGIILFIIGFLLFSILLGIAGLCCDIPRNVKIFIVVFMIVSILLMGCGLWLTGYEVISGIGIL